MDELSLKQNIFHSIPQQHPDGVLLQDIKQELIKQNLWNNKVHEFLLSAPFLM